MFCIFLCDHPWLFFIVPLLTQPSNNFTCHLQGNSVHFISSHTFAMDTKVLCQLMSFKRWQSIFNFRFPGAFEFSQGRCRSASSLINVGDIALATHSTTENSLTHSQILALRIGEKSPKLPPGFHPPQLENFSLPELFFIAPNHFRYIQTPHWMRTIFKTALYWRIWRK